MICGTCISETSDGNVILRKDMQQVTLEMRAEKHVCRPLCTERPLFVSRLNQHCNFSMNLGETPSV
jgi:hypothetical protein